jgi:uncharacterized protein YndB with AHSA1/START domain
VNSFMEPKVIGQTKSAGFQIGVRRTLPVSQEKAWELITSKEGSSLWLGKSPSIHFQPGERYETTTGASGEIRIVKPLLQLRLTWKKAEWTKASTIQIRIIPSSSNKTTISFHQENLPDIHARVEMKVHWEDVLSELMERAGKGRVEG